MERGCPQRAAETIGLVVGQVVMKTPTSVLTPVTKASKTLADSLQAVPVLGGADFTRLPVVGKKNCAVPSNCVESRRSVLAYL